MVICLRGKSPRDALRAVTAALSGCGVPDAAFDAKELLRYVLKTDTDPRLLTTPLTDDQEALLQTVTARRCEREPLQYILGTWDFMGLTLSVTPGVFCPRQDTEAVCEQAIALLQGAKHPVVWDLFAGTGCLGLRIAHAIPGAQVTCVEKELPAYACLKKNTAGTQVTPVLADALVWCTARANAGVDMIIANPPYLSASDMQNLQPEVAREPAAALYGGEDGLAYYRALLRDGLSPLRPGGWLVLEIGSTQAGAVCQMAQGNGWQGITCIRDTAGQDRCITAQKPSVAQKSGKTG